MTTANEWAAWEESWRDLHTSPEDLQRVIANSARARRATVFVRLLATGVSVASLALVGAALYHAGNAFEAALGLVVGAGIVAVWFADAWNRRDAADKVEAAPGEYLAARERLCHRQLAFVRLARIVVALDIAFLVPWWIGGVRVHGSGFSVNQVLTVWGPLAGMGAFVAWTFVVARKARSELRQLDRAAVSARES